MSHTDLIYLSVKVPIDLYRQILDYQERERLLSRGEAIRQILIAGLFELGIGVGGAEDDQNRL